MTGVRGPFAALGTTIGLAWAVGFLAIFHAAALYGTGDNPAGRLKRFDVLTMGLAATPDNFLWTAGQRLVGGPDRAERWRERAPIVAVVAGVAVTALCLGGVLLRSLFGTNYPRGAIGWAFAFGLGMGCCSQIVLGLGLAGQLRRNWFLWIAGGSVLAWLLAGLLAWRRRTPALSEEPTPREASWWLLAAVPFAALSLLSAMLPTADFDALGYHLLAPKEWHLAGRIEFLPHNVYASFPFLTEMFHLLGMTLAEHWFFGGIFGQATLWLFAPFGALAVAALGNRLFGGFAGALAAAIYLTTPWVFRLAAIPYVEGAMMCYGVLAVLAILQPPSFGWRFVAGAMVGCAASCKYTGLVMIGVPVGMMVAAQAWRARNWRPLAAFVLGGAVFFGPWLVRNAVWTGNPVYPLGYSAFGGSNWNAEKAAKFAAGHRSTDFSLDALYRYIEEIPIHSDWQSGLVFAFAPLAFWDRSKKNFRTVWPIVLYYCAALWVTRHRLDLSLLALLPIAFWTSNRRAAVGLWTLVLYLFAAFWLTTHRLDRFWLPLLPFAAVLAGAGWASFKGAWRIPVNLLAAVALFVNFVYCTTQYCALNDYLASLGDHGRRSRGIASPIVQLTDETNLAPQGGGVLFVGFSGVYYSERPAYYSSVFDDCLFETLAGDPKRPGTELPSGELRRKLRAHGVEFVAVDWNWVREYRKPGNYGFTDFVTPELFDRLTEQGVLLRLHREPNRKERGLELYRVQPDTSSDGGAP